MGKTKKVGSTGRFGVRYGRRMRQTILEVEAAKKEKKNCPKVLVKDVRTNPLEMKRVDTMIIHFGPKRS